MNIAPMHRRASARPRCAAAAVAAPGSTTFVLMTSTSPSHIRRRARSGYTTRNWPMAQSIPSTRRDVDAGVRTFASGLLLDLLSAIRQTAPGDLIGVTSNHGEAIEAGLE